MGKPKSISGMRDIEDTCPKGNYLKTLILHPDLDLGNSNHILCQMRCFEEKNVHELFLNYS